MKTRINSALWLIFGLTLFTYSPAQNPQKVICGMFELPLNQKVEAAELIIEGKVLESEGFWNDGLSLIYTTHTVEIQKVFKGRANTKTIEIITQGGQVGMEMYRVHPSLELHPGDAGVFFLENSPVLAPGKAAEIQFRPFGAAQGFAAYDPLQGIASDIFHTYGDIRRDLYRPIESQTNKPLQQITNYEAPAPQVISHKVTAISSFNPTTTTAGTQSVLTINGSNFLSYDGGSTSAVFFANADDGGATFVAAATSEIISWNTSQIQVEVPNGAGTGTFVVRNSSGTTFSSGSTLTIDYNHTNITFGGNKIGTELRNKNGTGGYTFLESTSTANSGVNFSTSSAVAPFQRALSSWQCATGFNFVDAGGTTTSQTVDANSNPDIAMFDNAANPLPAGVLGTAFSGFSSCDGITWFVNGVDIVFRRNGTGGVTWNFGPGATPFSQFDFESVALHELGHAHQLGHIISAGRVMHFSISNGSDQRVLNATSDIAGGNFVMTKSAVLSTCGGSITGMTSFNCTLPVELLEFSGKYLPGEGNQLFWQIETDDNHLTFLLEKSQDGENFNILHQQPSVSSVEKLQEYTYLDAELESSRQFYRLRVLDANGNISTSNVVEIVSTKTGGPEITAVYPNPFTNHFTLRFSFPLEENVELRVTDLNGKIIRKAEVNSGATEHTLSFGDQELPSGIYFLTLLSNQSQLVRKLLKF